MVPWRNPYMSWKQIDSGIIFYDFLDIRCAWQRISWPRTTILRVFQNFNVHNFWLNALIFLKLCRIVAFCICQITYIVRFAAFIWCESYPDEFSAFLRFEWPDNSLYLLCNIYSSYAIAYTYSARIDKCLLSYNVFMLIYAWRDISTSVFAIEPLFWICIFLTLFRDVINYGYCFMHLIWCLTLLQLHTILKNILWHSIVHVIDQSNRGRSTVEKLYSENTSPWWIMKNAEVL